MVTQILRVAFAFVGIIVGAGFASGQEVMQYFVAFGVDGIWGVIMSAVIMSVMALIILQLGSYFNAGEHGGVFRRVSHPVFSKILDIGVVVTLFSTGFVMFAGAGSNLNQQWGLPLWVGSVLMVLLVIAAGMLDVDKVTTVIGAITPFIIIFLTLASIYTLVKGTLSPIEQLDAAAGAVSTTLPHWSVAAVNYVGFNMMVAVSMAVVIGGSMFNPRVAGRGGLVGGLILGFLIIISALTLFVSVEEVGQDDMPMLTIINQLHPVLGQIMALVIYGMIFNTALGMFYALGRRITAKNPGRFRPVYVVTVLVGFVLSFVGFRNLVGYVYPILGYIGLLLIAVMIVAWVRGRVRIYKETERRMRIVDLLEIGREGSLTVADQAKLRKEIEESNLDEEQIKAATKKN
ncbi:hypothetical protein CDES_05295 [Corynebacterium deserti GIMN1.010]|uniref:Membrane protein YkvI n=1 Tax=Corynebacterium deserti GIMN1.010 TaxID=931089 RepID=A0A0M4CHS5_9CORY|nr:hypothetical protein [Corynebacterium deserti]ALC05496.1 hypothetical protein CDES_05295 [Corynebacterium deserti GIMN1.010]